VPGGLLVLALLSLTLAGCDLLRCQFGRSADADERCAAEEAKTYVYDVLRDDYLFAEQISELDVDRLASPEALLDDVGG
jgi:hypothetical protein